MTKKKTTKKAKESSQPKQILSVAKVGWVNEIGNFGIVLLSKRERVRLNVTCKSVVRVMNTRNNIEVLCVVQRQFKDLLMSEALNRHICSLNTKTAYLLKLIEETDTVEIKNDITESEYKEFQKLLPKNPFQTILDQIQ